MTLTKTMLGLVALAALAGCGGGGGGGSAGGGEGEGEALSREELARLNEQLLAKYMFEDDPSTPGTLLDDPIEPTYTAPANLPRGSAVYEGVIAASVEGDPSAESDIAIAGQIEMGVNFDATSNQIDGRIFGLVDGTGIAATGEIAISGGTIDRTVDPLLDYTYSANLSGNVGNIPGVSGTTAVSGTLNGDFLETGAAAALGSLDFTAGGLDFQGNFIAERQP